MTADGILLLYHRPAAPWIKDASTVREHLHSFKRHSRHPIWEVNVDYGFPPGLDGLEFRAILLHYSIFGMQTYFLDETWREYLDGSAAYKVAFFQDECTRCQRRFAFLNEHDIDCVYTCLEPSEFQKVYGRYTKVPNLVSNLPGYVSDEIVDAGRRFAVPLARRTVDVGYRGRPLPAYLGRGALEKHEIGVRFAELAAGSGLRLDIATGEGDRLYSDDWYRFMANCRCMLGVESGVSAFDLEDEVLDEYERRRAEDLPVGVDDLETLPCWEDVVHYRTASPRHFEAASLRVCQVLYEGHYSGVMEPMVHYIPLRKDFSNLDEVLALIRDDAVVRELTENAYRDLVASGDWSYRRLVAGLDETLSAAMPAAEHAPRRREVDRRMTAGLRAQKTRHLAHLYSHRFLGLRYTQAVIQFVHPVTKRVRRILGIPGPEPTA